jgi:hypothetical protein
VPLAGQGEAHPRLLGGVEEPRRRGLEQLLELAVGQPIRRARVGRRLLPLRQDDDRADAVSAQLGQQAERVARLQAQLAGDPFAAHPLRQQALEVGAGGGTGVGLGAQGQRAAEQGRPLREPVDRRRQVGERIAVPVRSERADRLSVQKYPEHRFAASRAR